MSKRIPRLTLVRDLRRVGNIVGFAPRYTDYLVHGEHSPGTIRERLGGDWATALRAVGFEPTHRPGKIHQPDACDAQIAHECRRAIEGAGEAVPTLTATCRFAAREGWRGEDSAQDRYLAIGECVGWDSTLRALGVPTLGERILEYLADKPATKGTVTPGEVSRAFGVRPQLVGCALEKLTSDPESPIGPVVGGSGQARRIES